MRLPALIAAAVLALGTAGNAQVPEPGLSAMNFFIGAWHCKRLANPDPSVIGTVFAFRGTLERANSWIVLAFDDGQVDITFDSVTKRSIFIYLGNGGEYGLLSGRGWQGNVLKLTDSVTSDGEATGAATFTRRSADVFTTSYAVRQAKRLNIYENICERIAK
ncbi:MAG TPA: hypothetical protein VGP41_14970 [Candidatus Lustribacter sp.]|nr:hypothetical protein [Candidatus Lustribacter sp.]